MTQISLPDMTQMSRLPEPKKPDVASKGESGQDGRFSQELNRQILTRHGAGGQPPAQPAQADAQARPALPDRPTDRASVLSAHAAADADSLLSLPVAEPDMPPVAVLPVPDQDPASRIVRQVPSAGDMSSDGRQAPAQPPSESLMPDLPVQPNTPSPPTRPPAGPSAVRESLALLQTHTASPLPLPAPPAQSPSAPDKDISSSAPMRAAVSPPAQLEPIDQRAAAPSVQTADPTPPSKPDLAVMRGVPRPQRPDMEPAHETPVTGQGQAHAVSAATEPLKTNVRQADKKSEASDISVAKANPAPVTAVQMVLGLVLVPVAPAVPAATQVLSQAGAPRISGSKAVPVAAPAHAKDTSPSMAIKLMADMASTDPAAGPDIKFADYSALSGSEHNAAQHTGPALSLAEHVNAMMSSGGTLADRDTPVAPMKVKVLEVATHLPVEIQPGGLFPDNPHSARPDMALADTRPGGATAPPDMPATYGAHQTALRTLNLALSGEDSAPLSVRMRLQGDQLNVAISSQHADAVAAILRDHSGLSDSLIGAGYKLDTLTVQLAGAPSGSGDQSGAGAGSGQGQMARQQDGRSDHMNREQNGRAYPSNSTHNADISRSGPPEVDSQAARARSRLYI